MERPRGLGGGPHPCGFPPPPPPPFWLRHCVVSLIAFHVLQFAISQGEDNVNEEIIEALKLKVYDFSRRPQEHRRTSCDRKNQGHSSIDH